MRLIPTVDSCCCIFSLKSGTIAIGASEAGIIIPYVVYKIVEASYSEKIRKSEVYTTCAVLAIRAILGILLVFGAKNRYWLPIKLWIVLETILMVMKFLTHLTIFKDRSLTAILQFILPYVVKLYCLLIVNSYYRALLADSTPNSPQECKCHELPRDISIVYVQGNVDEADKYNQWQRELLTIRTPPPPPPPPQPM